MVLGFSWLAEKVMTKRKEQGITFIMKYLLSPQGVRESVMECVVKTLLDIRYSLTLDI